jgi:hypothetical protein
MKKNLFFTFLLFTFHSSLLFAWEGYKSNLTGAQLLWFNQPVHYKFDSVPCADITDGSDYTEVVKSFDTWDSVVCKAPEFSVENPFDFASDGKIDNGVPGYVEDGENENLVIWINDKKTWINSGKDVNILGLTTLTYVRETGEIADADIELNDWKFKFTTTDKEDDTVIDIRNTMTHEIGHLLGLDHSKNPEATMYYNAPSGELKKRSLHDDDIAGICTIYQEKPAVVEDSSAEEVHNGTSSGCSSANSGQSEPMIIFALIVLIFVGVRFIEPVRAARKRPLGITSRRDD